MARPTDGALGPHDRHALVYHGGQLVLIDDWRAGDVGPMDARVAIGTVGICRTDIQVAHGQIAVTEPRVIGHEFYGRVLEVGAAGASTGVRVGDFVSANPLFPKGDGALEQLGVERDGVLASDVILPAACLIRMPPLPGRRGAYLEPLAAAMAVLEAGLDPQTRGLVCGEGRIAELTRRVLAAAGFAHIERVPTGHYDFAVETGADTIASSVRALTPGGTLVLKSRPHAAVPLPLREILYKRIRLAGALYGDFKKAAVWLAEDTVNIDDLLGTTFPMSAFREAFDAASRGETTKCFIEVSPL